MDDHDETVETIDLMKVLIAGLDRTAVELVPVDIKAVIDAYAAKRHRPGDFVLSVLENDLAGACARADHANIKVLPAIVAYCYNGIPGPCWGSPEIVQAWLTPETQDESVSKTTSRAHCYELRKVISENQELLRVVTDEGQEFGVQKFAVTGVVPYEGRVVITVGPEVSA